MLQVMLPHISLQEAKEDARPPHCRCSPARWMCSSRIDLCGTCSNKPERQAEPEVEYEHLAAFAPMATQCMQQSMLLLLQPSQPFQWPPSTGRLAR